MPAGHAVWGALAISADHAGAGSGRARAAGTPWRSLRGSGDRQAGRVVQAAHPADLLPGAPDLVHGVLTRFPRLLEPWKSTTPARAADRYRDERRKQHTRQLDLPFPFRSVSLAIPSRRNTAVPAGNRPDGGCPLRSWRIPNRHASDRSGKCPAPAPSESGRRPAGHTHEGTGARGKAPAHEARGPARPRRGLSATPRSRSALRPDAGDAALRAPRSGCRARARHQVSGGPRHGQARPGPCSAAGLPGLPEAPGSAAVPHDGGHDA